MTLLERASAYAAAFQKFPASHFRLVHEGGGECLYATWLLGNDYRNKSRYYGAYPPGYLARVMALFPDVSTANDTNVLHVFSGSLPPGQYERCDLVQPAELRCSVYDLPNVILNWRPRLVCADPPYSAEDATRYGTPMVDRRKAIAAIAHVVSPGGHLVWLDTVWPIHRKTEWRTVARITLVRSTNHRLRMATIFERQAA